jgi:NADH-quinone oxidoreductase subunit M
MQGSILQMVNHGISTGALFLLVGVIYDRRHTRKIEEFGGLAKVMPVYAAVFLVVTMASIGVPGTNGFVGEFMVIMGAYGARNLGAFAGMQAVCAAFGVILAAVYMLSMVQKVFFGPLSNPKNRGLSDLNIRETVALAPLVIMIFVIGFFPSTFLNRSSESVSSFETRSIRVRMAAQEMAPQSPVLLTNEVLAGESEHDLNMLNLLDQGAPMLRAQEENK